MSTGDDELRSLLIRGREARLAGDTPGASSLLGAAIERSRAVGDDRGQLVALLQLGSLWVEAGSATEALEVLTPAATLANQLQERLGQADAHIGVGRAQHLLGRTDDARSSFGAALVLYRRLRHPVGEARAELYLGRVSDGQQAFDHLDRAAALFERAGERRGQAEALLTLGEKSLEEGSLITADGSLREAVVLFRELGDEASAAVADSALRRVSSWPD